MRTIVILCALFFACSGGDSGGTGASSPEPAAGTSGLPRVTDSESAKASIGKIVRIAGTALNAKLGPVVSTGGLVVYCFGKQEWAADQVGNPVAVTGTLEQTDEFKAEVGPDGEQTAGTGGRDYLIRDCKVEGPAPSAPVKEEVDPGGGGW